MSGWSPPWTVVALALTGAATMVVGYAVGVLLDTLMARTESDPDWPVLVLGGGLLLIGLLQIGAAVAVLLVILWGLATGQQIG